MPDIQQYSVSIKYEAKGAEDVAEKTKKIEEQLDKLTAKAKSLDLSKSIGFDKIGNAANKFKSIFTGLVSSAVISKMTGQIKKLTTQTSDYIESVNLFRTSMGDMSGDAMNFVNKAESLLGLDPKAMMDSISSFQNLSEGVGIASDRAYIMSKNLTQLSGDLSSLANISLEEAQRKLLSGFSGQVQPLRKYGIALDQATLQETAYSLGLKQKVSEMTRAQKTELIYYQIMKSTQKMQGDLGRSLISPANALRVMQQEFKALGRAVGSIFIPIMLKIIPVVRAITQILTEAAQAIAKFFGFDMGNFDSDLSSVGNMLGGVSDGIGDIGNTADDTAKKMNKMLMPFDELNNITTSTGTDGGAGAGLEGIGGGLGIELPEYDMFESITQSSAEQVEKIKAKIKELLPVIAAVGTALGLAFVGAKIGNFIINVGNFIKALKEISPLLSAIAGPLKIIAGIAATIGGTILYISGIIDILNPNVDYLQGLLKSLGGALLVVGGVFLLFGGVPALVVAIIAAIGILGATIYRFRDNIAEFFTKTVPEFFAGVGKKLQELPGKIGYILGQALGSIVKFIVVDVPNAINKFFTETLPAWGLEIAKFLAVTVPAKFEEFGNWLKGLPAKLKEIGINLVLGFIQGIQDRWNRLMEDIRNFIDGFVKGFKDALGIHSPSTLFESIGKFVVEGLWNGIKGMWDSVKEKLAKVLDWVQKHLIQPIVGAFDTFKTTISTIWGNITSSISEKVQEIKSGIVTNFGIAYERVTNIFSNIATFFSGIWQRIATTFSSLGTRIGDAISGAVKSAINGVLGLIERIINKFISMINGALGLINNIPGVNIGRIKEIYLPRLEKGGTVDKGQMFIANEAGPELVGTIGNRTAVANQKQITTAIATATYNAISRALAENRTSDNAQVIQVNLGNRTVYEGYGTYKDERSNMLGVNI